MRILVVGAAGRFGSRLLPALIARGHEPIAFVRNPAKLESLIPADLWKAIKVVQGNGEDVPGLVAALDKYQCHGVICTAGSPSSPSGKGPESRQGHISAAVAEAAEQYARKTGIRIRGWWVTGVARLPDPLVNGEVIHHRIPKYRPEHGRSDAAVLPLDPSVVAWSMLCPGALAVTGPVVYPAEKKYQDVVQLFPESMRIPWIMWVWIYFWFLVPGLPILGILPMVFWRRYPHEAVADALAREFEEEKWVGHKVGY